VLKLFSDSADFSTSLTPEQALKVAEDLTYAAREVGSSEADTDE
jgi:hypothetical protein